MRIEVINNNEEFNKYVLNHKYGSILQTTYWANVKKETLTSHCLGFYEDDKQVGSVLLLERKMLFNKSHFYAPRGFVCNYEDAQLVTNIIILIKEYIIKNRGFVCEFDPEVPYTRYNVKGDTEIDNNFDIFNTLSRLTKHKGFNLDFDGSNQPRFQAVVDLKVPDLRLEINRKRRAIFSDSYLEKRGFEMVDLTNEEGITIFSNLSKLTEVRQGVYLRNESYFKNMYDELNPDHLIKVFGTKVDLHKLKAFLLETNQDETYLNDIDLIIKEEGQYIVTNAVICVLGTNMVQMFYGASDARFFRYNPGSKMQLNAMQWAKDNGYTLFNMGGVQGSLDDHLYKFKSVYNPMIYEYMGDFEIVANPMILKIYKIAKKMYKKLKGY